MFKTDLYGMDVRIKKYIKYLLLASVIYMPVFGFLDTLPIRIWDEARLAMNACEMHLNGDYIVTHFDGKPDMWNTKPPFLIWCQVVLMKFTGIHELAVRLPSAIAALLTCLALLAFSLKYLSDFWFGFIVILVLITSGGYIDIHATRTGDYDAMLTLFTTTGCLSYFYFLETKKEKYIYLFFLLFTMAVLTKGITGLLFVPALLLYTLSQKQLPALFKNKHFYIGLFLFLLACAGYYLLREMQNPGYLKAVQQNELGGRYFNVIEAHEEGFWYYYLNLIRSRFSAWYLLVPCGLIIGFFHKDKRIARLTVFTAFLTLTFFLIISGAQTKLEWYDVPLFPFLALLAAIGINLVFGILQKTDAPLTVRAIPFLFLFLVFTAPYHNIIGKTYKPKEYAWNKHDFDMSYFLKSVVKGKQQANNYIILYDGYNAHLQFYLKMLDAKGIHLSLKAPHELRQNDTVIACQDIMLEYLKSNDRAELVEELDAVKKYRIR